MKLVLDGFENMLKDAIVSLVGSESTRMIELVRQKPKVGEDIDAIEEYEAFLVQETQFGDEESKL